ncbi:protein FAM228A isoform X1 [Nerophis lumbriciformis]|uniref:protein FAM228A isoform X1 n=1 Tax=Nerophis lumbriciformis TaxID=546530 RepID=UPI002ADFB345|nr:protein FAM228A [Nerophis lumbriciformis]
MRPKRSNGGVITYHIPFNIRLVTSEAPELKCARSEVRLSAPVKKKKKKKSCGCAKQGKREDKSAVQSSRPRRGQLPSHTPTRRIQVKMEADSREIADLVQPLLDTDKELERFLSKYEEAKVLRRERMRKCWNEEIWASSRKKMDQHMSTCNPLETNMRQNLYDQYLQHGNTKGFVFLDTCDLKQYNPYLLHGDKPHNCKHNVAKLKEPKLLDSSKLNTARCEAGCQHKWVPQREHITPEANMQSFDTTESHAVDKICRTKIPFHIHDTAIPDGRCHHSTCWFTTQQ